MAKECGTGIFLGLDLPYFKLGTYLQSWISELFENFFINYLYGQRMWNRYFLGLDLPHYKLSTHSLK
jgi:hypothetical protein